MNAVIRYVDGQVMSVVSLDDWYSVRADGVDEIQIWLNDGRSQLLCGHSLYWCYLSADVIVLGQGSMLGSRPDLPENHPNEMVLHPDGRYEFRSVTFPDLPHGAIKLGHWRPDG